MKKRRDFHWFPFCVPSRVAEIKLRSLNLKKHGVSPEVDAQTTAYPIEHPISRTQLYTL